MTKKQEVRIRAAHVVELRGIVRNVLYRNLPIEIDVNVCRIVDEILSALPTTEIRREALLEAANIAEAIDSGRGNEREIAKAIRSLAKEDGRP